MVAALLWLRMIRLRSAAHSWGITERGVGEIDPVPQGGAEVEVTPHWRGEISIEVVARAVVIWADPVHIVAQTSTAVAVHRPTEKCPTVTAPKTCHPHTSERWPATGRDPHGKELPLLEAHLPVWGKFIRATSQPTWNHWLTPNAADRDQGHACMSLGKWPVLLRRTVLEMSSYGRHASRRKRSPSISVIIGTRVLHMIVIAVNTELLFGQRNRWRGGRTELP